MNLYTEEEMIRRRHAEAVRSALRRHELLGAVPDERPVRRRLATALRRLADRLDRSPVYTAPRA